MFIPSPTRDLSVFSVERPPNSSAAFPLRSRCGFWSALFVLSTVIPFTANAAATMSNVLNLPPDPSADFADTDHTFFLPADVTEFDPATGRGVLTWKRHRLGGGMLFNHRTSHYEAVGPNEWPGGVYAADPALPFSVEGIDAGTLRLRLRSSTVVSPAAPSLMLVREPISDGSWQATTEADGWRYTSPRGSVFIGRKPWRIEVRDPAGRMLTHSVRGGDIGATSFVRRAADYSRGMTAAFSLAPAEHVLGGGESFARLDKRGLRLRLSTTDALGTEGEKMYKPVPFFLSSRGYGFFIHTSAPLTADIGATHAARASYQLADDELDLFIFLGSPKDVLGSYTALTGRSPLPPLWSFGLWMSRITYSSEAETREVAAKLREHRIPSDVVHLDTGWFQRDWECDYRFSAERFTDPARMISDLRADGLRVSLWQLPYFIPRNPLFSEILTRGLAVRDAKGAPPTEDAILDFSNPETVAWYQDKLEGLLRLGVGAIKTDFAEAAPYAGLYASGTTGLYEHNLYPLRYQQAAAEVTRRVSGDSIIWARAGWAGAQRNPVHWGGDAGKSYSAMAGTLRGGLSLGISGFAFWSHDIGGFGGRLDVELYRKWLPFGMLTSHARAHGEPPKEPWLISPDFTDDFRAAAELRYRLMPYIYAQARDCSERGLPMLRALPVEYPDDPGAWLVDDAYLFGADMYVAPLFEAHATERDVYLPAGRWIDYQSGRVYAGGGWRRLAAGPIPAVILVRDGAILPHIALAQSTAFMDWSRLELRVFTAQGTERASGLVCLPDSNALVSIHTATGMDGRPVMVSDPLADRVKWTVSPVIAQP